MRRFFPQNARVSRARLGFALLACLVAPFLWSCNAQIFPGPMDNRDRELDPGVRYLWPEGPEEVTVIRHSDPVKLRAPGGTAGFPVRYFEKRQRTRAGAGVLVDAGGKAEVLWPSGSSVTLFGPGSGVVGSPSQGGADFIFTDLGRARIFLGANELLELPGGALLSGESGPYLLDRILPEVLRVRNQSKQPLTIAYRIEEFEIGPGQQVDLPLVSGGNSPRNEDGFEQHDAEGIMVRSRGAIQSSYGDGALELRSDGPGEIHGMGIRVQTQAGDRVIFRGLGGGREPEPAPQPEFEEELQPAIESGEAPAEEGSPTEETPEGTESPPADPGTDTDTDNDTSDN